MSEKTYILSERPQGVHVVTVWLSDDECASVHLLGVDPAKLELIAQLTANAINLAYKTGVEHGERKRSRQIKDLLNI